MPAFDSVLIANRGEIACRIIRSLHRMGISAIAVHSEAERQSRHVLDSDRALCIGPAPTRESYLDTEAVLRAARASGAQAIHPGYGFASENADFAEACELAGIAFIGPTPEQIRAFGLKHTARELAARAGVPLLPGSGVLESAEHARHEAERLGYPVMLKSSAGGGGIGMQLARDATELSRAFEAVQRLSRNNFGDASCFLERYVERARHIEVQLFGDGRGEVIALGERDCSAQRRHQKVIEETPAPHLSANLRRELSQAAIALGRSVSYRSAGTVEFVYDCDRDEFHFLEVNTRLQVEHGITEAVFGIDLVEWMVLTAAGLPPDLRRAPREPRGHAIEARIYAEDPARDFRPSAGLLTLAEFPESARVDTWVERGTEVSAYYDPLLAKIIVQGEDRPSAIERLQAALAATRLSGIETNVAYLRKLAHHPRFTAGELTTRALQELPFETTSVEVDSAGTLSLIVEDPGRIGYWEVGIPPSGPMDRLAHRLANRAVGNTARAASLELTLTGPTLKFSTDAWIALAGANMPATLDGRELPYYEPVPVRRGQALRLGAVQGAGCRTYLAVRGGWDVPEYLGSRTTFTLGGFGGHGGRALRRGDVLHIADGGAAQAEPTPIPAGVIPSYTRRWQLGVLYGPHGAPDFFTPADIEMLLSTDWEVHYQSSRTGVRLIGPKPQWARPDGGEAGLHPSNIHDVAYAIGAVDFTGDMPILLGPDGPSLGGFVCPATVIDAELWKLGQLRAGDRVRFVALSPQRAAEIDAELEVSLDRLEPARESARLEPAPPVGAVQRELVVGDERVVYRRAGDNYLLVEYGKQVLDLRLRFRVHALMQWLADSRLPGIIDLTPGIRSLQVHFDHRVLSASRLLSSLERAETELLAIDQLELPSRRVRLPLSWDDPATRLAISKYMQLVRPDAPWCPDNIEFIRRINGLSSERDVYDIVFSARYLVLGLGDVYLGAPVATPLDPRHRLVTTKYNPARTWTPENAVGIGGAYMCIYGMEGPGGYQFVGRTLQVFNRFRSTRHFAPDAPWLLRHFDQIEFYPVSPRELLEQRADFLHDRLDISITPTVLSLREHERFLAQHAGEISAFKARQQAAFEAERQRWQESGQPETPLTNEPSGPLHAEAPLDAGQVAVESPVAGSIWKLAAAPGAPVRRGDPLLILESMKMEVPVEAPADGELLMLLVRQGEAVAPGQRLAVIRSARAR